MGKLGNRRTLTNAKAIETLTDYAMGLDMSDEELEDAIRKFLAMNAMDARGVCKDTLKCVIAYLLTRVEMKQDEIEGVPARA